MGAKSVKNYVFNDGVNEFYVDISYDNYLSSTDFNVYTKSNILIDNLKINLFEENAKQLKLGGDFEVVELEKLSEEFDLMVLGDNGKKKCATKSHFFDDFYYLKYKSKYVIIYSLGGSRYIESIYIHGVWEI